MVIKIEAIVSPMTQKKVCFSVIIPVLDKAAYLLPFTLDSIYAQAKGDYRIIIIDGTKTGMNLGVKENTEIYPAAFSNLFAMMNQGVLQAKGDYIHFLNPGEFYISRNVFSFVEKFLLAYGEPDMAYSGCFIRHNFGQPTVFVKEIQLQDLQRGVISSSLQAFWFRRETLQLMGRLSEKFEIQGGLEIVCRIYSATTLRKAFMKRILTDYEYRKPSTKWAVKQFLETVFIIFFHFGFTHNLFSLIGQNYLKFVRWWWKMLKSAFWKQNVAY